MLNKASLLKSVVGRTGRFLGALIRRPLYFPDIILMTVIKCNVPVTVFHPPKELLQSVLNLLFQHCARIDKLFDTARLRDQFYRLISLIVPADLTAIVPLQTKCNK